MCTFAHHPREIGQPIGASLDYQGDVARPGPGGAPAGGKGKVDGGQVWM